ncbi:MAG: hypothetical protein ACI3W9_02480 [Eubacteriales bacterium]
MRKTFLYVLLFLTCFSAACAMPDNYPGQVKPMYWVSEDGTIAFYFPAEAGRGKASGRMIVDESTCLDIILEWSGKDGTVEVRDAGGEFLFSAATVTDKENLTCRFNITSVSGRLYLPDVIRFYWSREYPKNIYDAGY